MTDLHLALMAGSLALAFCLAAWLGRRRGDDAGDLRLVLGTGAGFGGAALILASAAAS